MQIHIRRGSEAYGPYTLEEVRSYLADKRLDPNDLAWAGGMPDWQPLGAALPALATLGDQGVGTPPPPVQGSFAAAVGSYTYAPAPLGARFGAFLVDGLVQLVFFIPGLLIWAGSSDSAVWAAAFPALLAGGIGALIYGFIKDGLGSGQSLGKRATGLMVVHQASNRPCSIGQSAVRSLVLLLSNVVPYLGWLVEPIAVLVSSDRRRFGDRAAGTQVIAARDFEP